MKTVRCDFTGNEFDTENRIGASFTFSNDGKFYRADLDVSPEAFMKFIVGNIRGKNIPFGRYVKHTTEEEKAQYRGKAGHYEPAKNVIGLIASLQAVEQSV